MKMTVYLAVAIMALCVLSAGADIVIDGDLSDWYTTAGVNSHLDGDEPSVIDDYDIKNSMAYSDFDNNIAYFAFDLYGDFQGSEGADPNNDYVAFGVNADRSDSTGGTLPGTAKSGFESYIYWNFDDAPVLYKYNGSWNQTADSSLQMASDNSGSNQGVEMTIHHASLDWPIDFEWGVIYENMSEYDDRSPNNLDQVGEAPEPATFALFALGLGALWLKRRKS
ncbi:MAG: PEP-CTERM sorting domain-containing protein [Armatimonadota bacterium]